MIVSPHCQIASLEGVINTLRREPAESRGAPALAEIPAAPAAPAGPSGAGCDGDNDDGRSCQETGPRGPGGDLLVAGGRGPQPTPPERPGVANHGAAQCPAPPYSPPRSPWVWTGKGCCQRSLEHRNGCLCRSGHLPEHPFASS